MSTEPPEQQGDRGPGGAGRPVDGSASRPSKNNRQEGQEGLKRRNLQLEPRDLPDGTGLRPLSVEPGRRLRDEAVHDLASGEQARPWYAVVSEWREWYADYLNSHIEYEDENGEIARTRLENSYQPQYGKRYYAKLKDFERAVGRAFEDLTTVMLTFTASHRNAEGGWRCPADHMRDIMEGYDAARKQLHQVLSGRNWEYARVWEPHADGYGHLHLAVFVEDGGEFPDLDAGDFAPVMESHVRNCRPAGREAHAVDGDAVSVRRDVNNLGSYISEYIGIFGREALDRPMTEQMFYAVTWATNTRRVDFSNGAHDLMERERVRRRYQRDTGGLEPEDGREAFEEWRESEAAESGESGEWGVASICTVKGGDPSYADPTSGGVETTPIEGRPGVDPPPHLT